MVSVASLLNPLPPSPKQKHNITVTELQTRPCVEAASTAKMLKSATVDVKTKPNGDINYKPCEIQNEMIKAEHSRFQVDPVGHIIDHPRHIPYSSDKKSFQQKTGRDSIEAYHYTFCMPGDTQKDAHHIMWDYNIGLVRITALFKSLKHSKTMPAKVMSANKGLREISHSITGGSITAQGYWVPYEAAKAVAATFCWKIRYALTPVFGIDFPKLCIDPGNPAFMSLRIDPAIVKQCEEIARMYRAQSQNASPLESPQMSTQSGIGQHLSPKPLRPKVTDTESGYGTDSDRSQNGSPTSTTGNLWRPVNTPRPLDWAPYDSPISAKDSLKIPPPRSKIRTGTEEKKLLNKREAVELEFPLDDSSINPLESPKRQKVLVKGDARKLTQEALAAQTLVELQRADQALEHGVRAMSRRATV